MKQLIEDAIEMIEDVPPEQALFITQILTWDSEMKVAFMLAYRIVSEKEDGR